MRLLGLKNGVLVVYRVEPEAVVGLLTPPTRSGRLPVIAPLFLSVSKIEIGPRGSANSPSWAGV